VLRNADGVALARFWHGSQTAVYQVLRHFAMKKLLVLAFAISSLLRPSLVLCVESTGDVRVEYQETYCCVSQLSASDAAIDSPTANGCDGCLDVSLSTHSLVHKRVSNAPQTASFVLVLPAASFAQDSSALVTHAPADFRTVLHTLSTTVIRR
jgi:hypothetical protein